MKQTIYALLTAMLLFSNFTVKSQTCPECEIALIRHATDEFESKTSMKYDEATNELFSHDYNFWSNYRSSNNQSTSLDASYSIFSASYGSNSASTESKDKFESMRTNYQKNHSLSTDEQGYISSKVASETSYKSWTDCIQGCQRNGGMFLSKIGNNDDEFIITLKNIPAYGQAGLSAKIVTISYTNCTVESGDLKQNSTIAPWNTLQAVFKRKDVSKDILISVTVSDLASPQPIVIPKYSESNKPSTPAIVLPSVPVGTIIPFAGNSIPAGWLLCDGSVVNESKYQALSYAIGTLWGVGDHSHGSFNLPDLRGMFLRGVDGQAGNDPDKDSRRGTNGGSSGNAVGSRQDDMFKLHNHGTKSSTLNSPANSGNQFETSNQSGIRYNVPTDSQGGNETRPKNAYVLYIIKY